MEKPKSREKCGRHAFVNLTTGKIVPYHCKGRSCTNTRCRELYAKKRVGMIKDLVEENKLDRFFTLTLDEKRWYNSREAWEEISHVWSKFRKRLNREYKGIKFVAILEKHKKNDRPHIHGFWNQYVSQGWISKNWDECGGGRVVDIRRVEDDVSSYVGKQLDVAKYVGKDNVNVGSYVKKRKRIFWRSTGLKCEAEKKEKEKGWVLVKEVFYDEEGNLLDIARNFVENIGMSCKGIL